MRTFISRFRTEGKQVRDGTQLPAATSRQITAGTSTLTEGIEASDSDAHAQDFIALPKKPRARVATTFLLKYREGILGCLKSQIAAGTKTKTANIEPTDADDQFHVYRTLPLASITCGTATLTRNDGEGSGDHDFGTSAKNAIPLQAK